MLLSQAANQWICHKLAVNARPATMKLYSGLLTSFLSYGREHNCIDASQFTGNAIQGFCIGKRDSGYADTTILTDHRILTAWRRWMESRGVCEPINYKQDCPRPKVDSKTPRWLNDVEYTRLVAAARAIVRRYHREKIRDIALVLFLVDTGLRKSEALRLNVGDVDWERRKLRVSASAKSRKERWVYFGETCARALRLYLTDRGYTWLGWKLIEGNTDAALWITRQGTRLEATRAWSIVREIAAVAGLDDVCVHTLRHTSCTLLLSRHMPITEVRELLGHARLTTTLGYTHLIDEKIGEHYRAACPGDS